MENQTKVCANCKEEKPINQFGKDKYTRDGLLCSCKSCRKFLRKDRKENPEKYKKPTPIIGKICNTCGTDKVIDEFYKDNKYKDGHQNVCKSCRLLEVETYRRNKGILSVRHRITDRGKICSKCGVEKPLTEYSYHKTGLDGLRPDCKTCQKEWKQRFYVKNKITILETQKTYNKLNKKKIKLRHRTYYLNNKEQTIKRSRQWVINNLNRRQNYLIRYKIEKSDFIKQRNKQYILKNRDKIKRYRILHKEEIKLKNTEWRVRNRAKLVAINNKRRARKNAVGGNFTREQWENLKRKYKYCCLKCGRKEPEIKLTVDHVFPLSKGGWNDISNLQPLCGQCNSEKNGRYWDYRPDSPTYGEGWKKPSLWG